MMEEAIYTHAILVEQKFLYGEWEWYTTYVTTPPTRTGVCNGGIGLAAIAIFDKYEINLDKNLKGKMN